MIIRLSILLSILFFTSCSNPNKSRVSNSNFLAYYNSFYMAEKQFNEAIEIIDKNEKYNDEISEQAKSLLKESIQNALIVEEKLFKKWNY